MTDDVGVQPLEYDIELPLNEFTQTLMSCEIGPFGHEIAENIHARH